MEKELQKKLVPLVNEEAISLLYPDDTKGKPVTVIGTKSIRDGFDSKTLGQALNVSSAPGVTDVVVNPDAHIGYGAPIGCVLVSPSHIYPGPVGVDIKCSMSLLQLDLPQEELIDKKVCRALIDAITDRTPTGPGMGQRNVRKPRHVSKDDAILAVTEGASETVCKKLGIPFDWASRCEDAFHRGHDGTVHALSERLKFIVRHEVFRHLDEKLLQLGSYGGGNHFGECEVVELLDVLRNQAAAETFGLSDGKIAFFSHCGSRGFGNILATNQFRILHEFFGRKGIPLPANDRELVYAPAGTPEADSYLDDMALGANFATVNHLLINSLVLEAFREVFPGVNGSLVYFISHNIARREVLHGQECWVHRKGATRAFPAGHAALTGTPFAATGHPILLPGNPLSGSVVMVAEKGAEKSCYSVNHGAGRQMGRRAAFRDLDQEKIDKELRDADILTNCRVYPRDEAPEAYKDFDEVVKSVELAGLARSVARLKARFVIKDSSEADD